MSIGERLKIARKQRGLSEAALAEQAGVSQEHIARYEQERVVPDSQSLIRLAKALGVSLEWLMRPVTISLPTPAYRSHANRLKEWELAWIEQQVQEWLERYLAIEDILQGRLSFVQPEIRRTIKTLEETEQVAEALRQAWNLGDDAIPSMIDTLEKHGIRVGLIPAENHDHFDALALSLGPQDLIMVVKANVPGDRQRFSLAHELGHLVLEMPSDWSRDQMEKAANRFSAAFLVPQAVVFRELGPKRTSLDLLELHLLKHHYGLSMQAWIYRAYDLKIISEETKQWLFRLFRQRGWHRQEPGDAYPPEKTDRLERMVLRAFREGLISESRASELLGCSLEEFFHQAQSEHGGLPALLYTGCECSD
ncbi:MAG: XRE family transcriptional regulator [Gloeomargarita sp. SKYB31]|nr:XRE family transcriptional regulator [Gloeomargarita sp. SKYB31]